MKSNAAAASFKKSDALAGRDDNVDAVPGKLGQILSDTYILYLKTQNFHWNVEGQRFVAIHTLTEQHYGEMAVAIDKLAERMRALGYYAPGSFRDFLRFAEIDEAPEMPLSDQEMLNSLERDHMRLVLKLRDAIETAEGAHDTPTADLLTERREAHEKAAWMYRSLKK